MQGTVGRMTAAACAAGAAVSIGLMPAREARAPAGSGLLSPVRIASNGKPISVEIGHAAPAWADIDGDGKHELLVGQFGGGKLRIYKNLGSQTEPRFGDFTWFQAGGAVATVPYG
jgi:hypothetical protein